MEGRENIKFIRLLDYYISLELPHTSAKKTLKSLDVVRDYHSILESQIEIIREYQESNLLNEGYAFSDYTMYFLSSQNKEYLLNPNDKFLHQLISKDYFSTVYSMIRDYDDSAYIKDIFTEVKTAKDARRLMPYLIIFTEKILRILTGNEESITIKLYQLRDKVEKSIREKNYKYKPYINDDLLVDAKLFNEIQQIYEELYLDNIKVLIEHDLYQSENRKPNGVLINRHTFLHGKFNFDNISNKNVLQMTFLIKFLYQLKEQTTARSPLPEEL